MSRSSCFDCGSSDGLAIYPDGSYCHACHTQTPSKSLIRPEKSDKLSMEMPVDNGKPIPPEARKWLLQYLSDREIDLFCFWSEKYNRICFPYYIRPEGKDYSDMIMCWARTLKTPTKMKWIFLGDNSIMPFFIPSHLTSSAKRVCLVEDVISGTKVSKFIDTIVLGTTDIGDNSPILTKLGQYDKVVLFLDGDSAGKKGSEKLRNKLKLLYNVVTIRNTKDPKCYADKELEELLND